jgi:hypothetical protein
MTTTFDLFTKRTLLFYIGTPLSVIAILMFGILRITNGQALSVFGLRFEALSAILFLIVFFPTFTFAFLASYGLIRTYVKDGELILGDDYLVIDGTKILLTEAQNLSFKIGYRTNRRFGKIVGNRISVLDKNGYQHSRRFVIGSRDNTLKFDAIAAKWVKDGIGFGLIYYNIFL